MTESTVLSEKRPAGSGRAIGIATLNAEKSLNALSLDMVDALTALLREWEADDSIVCVLLRGAGKKAFCAGGDVVRLHQSAVNADDYAQTFFEREYRLDYLIHRYAKPIIVWGHGIVMGGGMGLLAGASHRVVTEQTSMAMPEVGIGLYPDVGGSWFLNRMPGRVGLFLAMTGATINASDALFVGLADYFIPHARQKELIEVLAATFWSDSPEEQRAAVDDVLQTISSTETRLSSDPPPPGHNAQAHFEIIQRLTDHSSVEAMVSSIAGYSGEEAWLLKAAAGLQAGCPASIRLIPEVLSRAKSLSLREVFQLELIVSTQCVRLGNFREGVRALLIDKDRRPVYEQADLSQVSDTFLAQHFSAPWGNTLHPLADL